jgi:anti-sigma regulatory factor (Ser/Thr protein kinase)
METESGARRRSAKSGPTDQRTVILLARDPASVAEARGWLDRLLAAKGISAPVRSDAVLIVSELVTNALRHGLGEITVRSGVGDASTVDVAVTDGGSDLPEMVTVRADRVGGVGLHIVDRLATKWGVAPFPGGKTVWATLTAAGAADR